jgi:hypothetical protein
MIWNPWKEIAKLREEAKRMAVFRQYDKDFIDQQRAKIDALSYNEQATVEALHATLDRADKLNLALQDVIAQEQPTSNATVRRMAKIARAGLQR